LAIWAYTEKQIDLSGHPAYIGAMERGRPHGRAFGTPAPTPLHFRNPPTGDMHFDSKSNEQARGDARGFGCDKKA
jgi:hypothetical protein